QAEDGIRDLIVTGVQTCALPILRVTAYDLFAIFLTGLLICVPAAVLALLSVLWNIPGALAIALIIFPRDYRYARNLVNKAYSLRSEERRVGKECKSRWSPEH